MNGIVIPKEHAEAEVSELIDVSKLEVFEPRTASFGKMSVSKKDGLCRLFIRFQGIAGRIMPQVALLYRWGLLEQLPDGNYTIKTDQVGCRRAPGEDGELYAA